MQLAELVSNIQQKLNARPLVFVAAEAERGLGLEDLFSNYQIAASRNDAVSAWLVANGKGWQAPETQSTADMLTNLDFHQYLKGILPGGGFGSQVNTRKLYLQFFKNTSDSSQAQLQAADLDPEVLNMSAAVTRELENKIKQYQLLSDSPLAEFLPPGEITSLDMVDPEVWKARYPQGFVVQLPFGHTGSSTYMITPDPIGEDNWRELAEIRAQFPKRACRVVAMVTGIPLTVNACIAGEQVFVAGLSYQYTGIEGLTALRSATVGNDWELVGELLTSAEREKIIALTVAIGELIRVQAGFRGLFGIDIIWDRASGKLHLIEINPRQTASIPMHTKLQLAARQIPLAVLHLAEFLGISVAALDANAYNRFGCEPLAGAQVMLRSQQRQHVQIAQHKLQPGIYRLLSDNAARQELAKATPEVVIFLDHAQDRPLIRQGEGFHLGQFDSSGVLISLKQPGTEVDFNEEMARMQAHRSLVQLVDGQVQLLPFVKDALAAIKEQLTA